MANRLPTIKRETIERLSALVGVPITEYRGDRKPVINGRVYMSYRAAYQYLYSKLPKGTQR